MKIVLFLSELEVLASKNSEKLYLANSDQLIRLVHKTNLTGVIDQQCIQIFAEEEHLEAERLMRQRSGKSKYSANYFMSLFGNSKSGGASRHEIAMSSLKN